MLYHLLSPTTGTLYIRNFHDRGDKRLSSTTARINTIHPIHRIEATLLPPCQEDQQPLSPTTTTRTLRQLISFTQRAFNSNQSFVCSKQSPFTYVAQIDWSFITKYHDISKLVDSVSCHQGLEYHLALTNITPVHGGGFRDSEIYITSTGTTRLKLPIHAFVDESLVTYLCSSLPCSLTEVCVADTIPVDSTTLSWACRNLSRLLEYRAKDIRRLTIPLGLPHLFSVIPSLPKLYDLTLTDTTSIPSSNKIVSALSQKMIHITILTLPVISFPFLRNTLAKLPRLQELHLTSSPGDTHPFTLLPAHSAVDFAHLRCLSYSGTTSSFLPLLSTLFPSPSFCSSLNLLLPTPRSSTTSTISSSQPETEKLPKRTEKFINLTLQIPSLVTKHDIPKLLTHIHAYFPKGVDIVKVHVSGWGVKEPKGGKWWTKARMNTGVGIGVGMLPGKVMSDFTHPCGFELGCKLKKSKMKRRRREGKDQSSFCLGGIGRWLGRLWKC